MAYEELDRKTATAALEFGMDAYKVGLTAEQAERALAFDEKKLATTISENEKDRSATLAAALARTSNPTEFQTIFNAYKAANPGLQDAQIIDIMQGKGLVGSSQSGMGALPGVTPQTGGAGEQQPVIINSRPA
jgi:uncharacterized surface protein with fasciclin (FAS1) repeats